MPHLGASICSRPRGPVRRAAGRLGQVRVAAQEEEGVHAVARSLQEGPKSRATAAPPPPPSRDTVV